MGERIGSLRVDAASASGPARRAWSRPWLSSAPRAHSLGTCGPLELSTVNDIELAVAAADAGAGIVLEHFGRRTAVDFKGVNDPVTAVDMASEAAIVDLPNRIIRRFWFAADCARLWRRVALQCRAK